MSDPTFYINLIEVRRRVGRPAPVRRCRVTDPATGCHNWHGLGLVTEPLSSYLGHRVGDRVTLRLPRRSPVEVAVPDHFIALPALGLAVVRIDVETEPHKFRPGSVADLGNLGTPSAMSDRTVR